MEDELGSNETSTLLVEPEKVESVSTGSAPPNASPAVVSADIPPHIEIETSYSGYVAQSGNYEGDSIAEQKTTLVYLITETSFLFFLV